MKEKRRRHGGEKGSESPFLDPRSAPLDCLHQKGERQGEGQRGGKKSQIGGADMQEARGREKEKKGEDYEGRKRQSSKNKIDKEKGWGIRDTRAFFWDLKKLMEGG